MAPICTWVLLFYLSIYNLVTNFDKHFIINRRKNLNFTIVFVIITTLGFIKKKIFGRKLQHTNKKKFLRILCKLMAEQGLGRILKRQLLLRARACGKSWRTMKPTSCWDTEVVVVVLSLYILFNSSLCKQIYFFFWYNIEFIQEFCVVEGQNNKLLASLSLLS